MNKVSISVSAKIITIEDCVKLIPAQNLSDTIMKDQTYDSYNGKSMTIVNYCNQSFNLPETILFSDNSFDGNFEVKLSEFSIGANQTLNIPIKYFGTYKGQKQMLSFEILLNNTKAVYNISVNMPKVNNPPILSDMNFELPNRGTKTFIIDDFLDHFTDLDGDTIDVVWITGDVSGYKLEGEPYVAGTEITKSQINSGLLQYISQDTDDYTESVVIWSARDTSGTNSKMN